MLPPHQFLRKVEAKRPSTKGQNLCSDRTGLTKEIRQLMEDPAYTADVRDVVERMEELGASAR